MCMGKAPWSKETSPSGKLLITADDVAHRPSLSRATIYKMLASGELHVFRTGRAVYGFRLRSWNTGSKTMAPRLFSSGRTILDRAKTP